MGAHTPGPWKLGGLGENLFGEAISVEITGADEFPVAEVLAVAILPNYNERLGIEHWSRAPGEAFIERSAKEVAANAQLMAMAPDIYRDAKALVNWLNSFGRTNRPRRSMVPAKLLESLESTIASVENFTREE